MHDERGTYEDGYRYARQGGKPSEVKNSKGLMIGYRRGPWLEGFRKAQIDMREELRAGGIHPMFPRRYKISSIGWNKQ